LTVGAAHVRTPAATGLLTRLARLAAWCAAGAAAAFVVAWLIGELSRVGMVSRWDHSAVQWFVHHRTAGIDRVLVLVTGIGSYRVIEIVGAAIGVGFSIRDRSAIPLLIVGVAVIGLLVMQHGLTILVHEPAPPARVAVGPAGGYPSGGTARVVAVVGLGAAFAAEGAKRKWIVAIWAIAGLAVLAEAASRLVLARHWPLDVIGGLALGGLWLAALWGGRTALFPRRVTTRRSIPPPSDGVAGPAPSPRAAVTRP
jgi:membrane-associated phospholipid phosphatase